MDDSSDDFSDDERKQVERYLEAVRSGDEEAESALSGFIYKKLKKLAHNRLRLERRGHTLKTTELVHEALLKLGINRTKDWRDRNHFFGAAANAMRQVLIEHYRNRTCLKRAVEYDPDVEIDRIVVQEKDQILLRLDDALYALNRLNKTQVRVVVMRFFGGLTLEEIAEVMNIPLATVRRHWRHAQTWLKREIES